MMLFLSCLDIHILLMFFFFFFAGQSLPPRSLNSTPISQQGPMNPSLPFTSSSKAVPSQNPLSLIMSQMSKYAMPSSTPLYHDAIKTIATSDDEMLPDRPLLAGVNVEGRKTGRMISIFIYMIYMISIYMIISSIFVLKNETLLQNVE